MELYPYQGEVIKKLYRSIREGEKRILLYAPTGAGKTVMIASVIRDAISRDRRLLFVVHRNELVQQSIATLESFGVQAGVIKAGWKADASHPVQVASVQTLASRGCPELDIVIIDECHTTSYYKACREILGQHDGLVIGVTATPWRTRKGEGLREHFKTMVSAPTPKDLMAMGFLVSPVYYGYNNEVDLKSVRTRAGEYVVEDLDVVCNTPAVITRIVEEYQRLASSRTCICFAVSVSHAENIAQTFSANGIPAAHIAAGTPLDLRAQLYEALAREEIMVLCSVGVLTEGFDVRSISSVVLARPTQSMALNYQMVGRGLRTCAERMKEDCIVLDFANNTERHGMVQMLDKVEMDAPLETDGDALTRSCPACNTVVPLSEMVCPNCGYGFPACGGEGEKRERLEDLIKLMPPDEKKKRKAFLKFASHAFENGMSPNWASRMFKAKYHKWPTSLHRFGAVFPDDPSPQNQEAYLQYLLACLRQKPSKDPVRFVRDHMEWEFGEKLIEAPEFDLKEEETEDALERIPLPADP